MTKRLTAKDLRNELQDLKMQLDGCEARIRRRAVNLVKQYPDVVVGKYPIIDRYLPVYAKDYSSFDERSISDALRVIEIIEKHLESLHPHKQTAIKFPTDAIHVVPGGPVGERVIFIKGKAYSRIVPIFIKGKAYSRIVPICNCDDRDMPIYEDEGKRWCPQCGYEVK